MAAAATSTIRGGHPYGIQPWGNYLTHGHIKELHVRAKGLGPSMHVLKDEIILDILGALPGDDLARVSRCSRALYVFAHHQDLWKALTLTELTERQEQRVAATVGDDDGAVDERRRNEKGEGPRLRYQGTWKETYISIMATIMEEKEKAQSAPPPHQPIRIAGLYSDVLHAPYAAAKGLGRLKSQWLTKDNCPRLHKPSVETFRAECEEPNRPCVLTGVADEWPALTKWASAQLLQDVAGPDYCLHGGGLSFSIQEYAQYAATQHDDLPLYIFDSRFAEKSPAMAADYVPYLPPYFQENADLFSLLGTKQRPDHRWLIWGPKGSGSSFHKDPNATSAWNAVIRGSKKWILVPPHLTPAGVHPSQDGLDLATPVTLIEWFEGFYTSTGAMKGVIEAVVKKGEVMFVPRGWWHLVLNLDEAVAITQNYVSEAGLPHVLSFLDDKRHLISGILQKDRSTLYERFIQALQEKVPHILNDAQERRNKAKALARGPLTKKPRLGLASSVTSWSHVISSSNPSSSAAAVKSEGGEEEKEGEAGSTEKGAAAAAAATADDDGGGGGFRFSFAL